MGSIFDDIKSIHPDLRQGTKGWWRCKADETHNDQTLCFNFETMWVNEFRSGLSCSIFAYLRNRGIAVDYEQHHKLVLRKGKREAKLSISLPEGFTLIGTKGDYLGERVYNYVCLERKIPLHVAQEMMLGYVPQRSEWLGYVIFPNVVLGSLDYLSGRAFLMNYPKHKNIAFASYNRGSTDTLYNQNALYRKHDELFVQEGCFDALTMYPNAVALYKWKLSPEQLQLLLKYDGTFVIAPDKGFYNEAKQLAITLLAHRKRVKLLKLPYEGSSKDVNNLGCDIVRNIVAETSLSTFANLNR